MAPEIEKPVKPETVVEHLTTFIATMRDHFQKTNENSELVRRGLALRHLQTRPDLTVAALLNADFGTDQPNGLDIRHRADVPIEIKNMTDLLWDRDCGFFAALGAVLQYKGIYHIGTSRVSLNPLSNAAWRPSLSRLVLAGNILMHESIHRLQWNEASAGWSSSYNNRNMDDVLALEPAHTLREKGRRLMVVFNRAYMSGFDSLHAKSSDIYMIRENEIQARLHEILATGYAAWQKMPVTKTELWAALHNAGMKMPASLARELHETDAGRAALRDFAVSRNIRGHTGIAVRFINRSYAFLTSSDAREKFWNRALPAIYGNLLELYGDGPGRARMDMGINPRPHLPALTGLLKNPIHDDGRAQHYIDSLPASLAPALINTMMAWYPDDDDPKTRTASRLIHALLQRPDIRAAASQEGNPPLLLTATLGGRRLALEQLVKGGLDPLKTYTVRRNGQPGMRFSIPNFIAYATARASVEPATGLSAIFRRQVFAWDDTVRAAQRIMPVLRDLVQDRLDETVLCGPNNDEPTTMRKIIAEFERSNLRLGDACAPSPPARTA